MQAISIAQSGLTAATARLAASASNGANAETSGPVPPSEPGANSGAPSSQPAAYRPIRATQSEVAGGGVQVSTAAMLPSWSEAYDPSAPYADGRGMVATPNVDLIDERVEQIMAKQAYEANLASLKAADEMERTLVDLRA